MKALAHGPPSRIAKTVCVLSSNGEGLGPGFHTMEACFLLVNFRERNVSLVRSRWWEGALRDDPKNGCEGDHRYEAKEPIGKKLERTIQSVQESEFVTTLLRGTDQENLEIKSMKSLQGLNLKTNHDKGGHRPL